MKKRVQHLLSALLALCITFGMYNLTVSATGADPAESGTQDNPWDISADAGTDSVNAWYEGSEQNGYTLIISGEGKMTTTFRDDAPPWKSFKSNIIAVEIQEGVTNVGAYAFNYCRALKNVSLPDSLKEIGTYAFHSTSVKHLTIPVNVTTIGRMIANPTTYYEVLGNPESVNNHAFSTSLVSAADKATAEALNAKTNVSAIIVLNGGVYGETDDDLANLSYGLIAPVKEDFRFDGWYQNADFSGQRLAEDRNGRTTVNINNIYYAKWSAALEASPSPNPTAEPTAAPTEQPSASPSAAPTGQPSASPSAAPTEQPSASPSAVPTEQPSQDEKHEVAPADAKTVNDIIDLLDLPDGYTIKKEDLEKELIPGGTITVTAVSEDGSEIIYRISKEPELIVEADGEYEITPSQKPLKYYEIGKDNTLVIKSTGALEKIQKVQVDSQVADESNYILESGSTILTFTKTYMDTLSAGEHLIEMVYEYGTVEVLVLLTEESTAPTPTAAPTEQPAVTPSTVPAEPTDTPAASDPDTATPSPAPSQTDPDNTAPPANGNDNSQDSTPGKAETPDQSGTMHSPKTGDNSSYGTTLNDTSRTQNSAISRFLLIIATVTAVILGVSITIAMHRKYGRNNSEGRKER